MENFILISLAISPMINEGINSKLTFEAVQKEIFLVQ